MASPAAWAAGCPWLVEHSVPASRIHAHCQHSGKLGLVFKLLLVELAEQCVLRLVLCQVRFLQTFPQIVTCGFTVCNAACWGEVLKFSLTAFSFTRHAFGDTLERPASGTVAVAFLPRLRLEFCSFKV